MDGGFTGRRFHGRGESIRGVGLHPPAAWPRESSISASSGSALTQGASRRGDAARQPPGPSACSPPASAPGSAASHLHPASHAPDRSERAAQLRQAADACGVTQSVHVLCDDSLHHAGLYHSATEGPAAHMRRVERPKGPERAPAYQWQCSDTLHHHRDAAAPRADGLRHHPTPPAKQPAAAGIPGRASSIRVTRLRSSQPNARSPAGPIPVRSPVPLRSPPLPSAPLRSPPLASAPPPLPLRSPSALPPLSPPGVRPVRALPARMPAELARPLRVAGRHLIAL
jgi:hypothetical protein